MPPSPAALKDGPTRIGVIMPSNDTLQLRDPAFEGDSVIGWVEGRDGVQRRAFSIADVQALVVQKANYGPGIVGGILAGMLSFSLLIFGLYATSAT